MSAHTGEVVTWFGNPDDPSDRAYFRIQRDIDSGVYPDWEADEFGDTRHIAGSDSNDIYLGGFGPETFTVTVHCDTRDAARALRIRRNTVGTLRLLRGFTGIAGASVHDFGVDYEDYANVLMRRTTRVLNLIGGVVECDVTFILLGDGTVT